MLEVISLLAFEMSSLGGKDGRITWFDFLHPPLDNILFSMIKHLIILAKYFFSQDLGLTLLLQQQEQNPGLLGELFACSCIEDSNCVHIYRCTSHPAPSLKTCENTHTHTHFLSQHKVKNGL